MKTSYEDLVRAVYRAEASFTYGVLTLVVSCRTIEYAYHLSPLRIRKVHTRGFLKSG